MDLYAFPPEEFTAARDAAAKVDRSLKALRKPSVSAWVLNTLVRHDPGLLAQLTELGAALAQAQEHGQGGQLRELGEQRRSLVAAVTDHALGLVGRELSAAVRAEVAETLEAALADPSSAEAVRSGQLVRPLSYAGFGAVDLAGAVAPLRPTAPAVRKPKKPAKEAAALEAAALLAAGALDDAVGRGAAAARAAAAATAALETVVAQEQAAAEAVRQAREALAAAEVEQQQAHRRRGVLEKEQQTAARRATAAAQAVAAAQDVSDTARKALDQLRRGT